MPPSDNIFYCVKCRTKVHGEHIVLEQNKIGRYQLRGKCDECGTKTFKFVSEADAQKFKRISQGMVSNLKKKANSNKCAKKSNTRKSAIRAH